MKSVSIHATPGDADDPSELHVRWSEYPAVPPYEAQLPRLPLFYPIPIIAKPPFCVRALFRRSWSAPVGFIRPVLDQLNFP